MDGRSRFRRFDLGSKAIEGIFDRSLVGAIVTIASVTLMVVLVLSELLMYIKVDTSSHMAVSDFHELDAITARLHATFPYVECKDLEVVADRPRRGADKAASTKVASRPASKAESRPFKAKSGVSGCTLDGTLEVERASGSIVVHVMHHDPARMVMMGVFPMTTKGEARGGPKGVAGPNVTHNIHDFGFGPTVKGPVGEGRNPLAQSSFVSEHGSGLVKYSLKVVPISHKRLNGAEVKTHTYSANVGFVREKELTAAKMTIGAEFSYDFTPVMVRYTDTRKSMFEFITSVCAIVGGIYTVSGLLVRVLRGASRKKRD